MIFCTTAWLGVPNLSLHYMVSMCKGRRESLVDNHVMGNVQMMGKRRVITDRDTHPPDPPRERGNKINLFLDEKHIHNCKI